MLSQKSPNQCQIQFSFGKVFEKLERCPLSDDFSLSGENFDAQLFRKVREKYYQLSTHEKDRFPDPEQFSNCGQIYTVPDPSSSDCLHGVPPVGRQSFTRLKRKSDLLLPYLSGIPDGYHLKFQERKSDSHPRNREMMDSPLSYSTISRSNRCRSGILHS